MIVATKPNHQLQQTAWQPATWEDDEALRDDENGDRRDRPLVLLKPNGFIGRF